MSQTPISDDPDSPQKSRYEPCLETGALNLGEANHLTAALLARLSSDCELRGLVVKGLALSHHGLRSSSASVDTDYLVEPGRAGDIVRTLAESGWVQRTEPTVARRLTTHSRTLYHPAWPNDADIHSEFPGLLAGPSMAFEVLWEHRVSVTVAGQKCWILDRSSSIVIWALHSLRGTRRQPRHADELHQLTHDVLPTLSTTERAELSDRMVELGADEPLRAVPQFAALVGDRRGPRAPGAYEQWQGKLAQATEVSPWLQVLRAARVRERAWLLFRALWPSADDLRLVDESLVDTPVGRVRSRLRRPGRLVRRIVERRRQAH